MIFENHEILHFPPKKYVCVYIYMFIYLSLQNKNRNRHLGVIQMIGKLKTPDPENVHS